MIKGNTKKFIENIYAEFEDFFDGNAEGVKHDIECAGGIRNYVEVGCFMTYTYQAIDFLARVYENTDEEKARFRDLPADKIWERYVNVVCAYLPRWLKSKNVC